MGVWSSGLTVSDLASIHGLETASAPVCPVGLAHTLAAPVTVCWCLIGQLPNTHLPNPACRAHHHAHRTNHLQLSQDPPHLVSEEHECGQGWANQHGLSTGKGAQLSGHLLTAYAVHVHNSSLLVRCSLLQMQLLSKGQTGTVHCARGEMS